MRAIREELYGDWEKRRTANNTDGEFWYCGTAFILGEDIVQRDGKYYFTDKFLTSQCGDHTWDDEITSMEETTEFSRLEPEDVIEILLDGTYSEEQLDFYRNWFRWWKNE